MRRRGEDRVFRNREAQEQEKSIRNRIYTCLKDEMLETDSHANYMTVPAAIKELEKIEMVRQADQVYRLDYAVTRTQKSILKAFGLDSTFIKKEAVKISKQLSEDK